MSEEKNKDKNKNTNKLSVKAKLITIAIFIVALVSIGLIAYFGTHLKHYVSLKTIGKTQVFDSKKNKYVIKEKDKKIHIYFKNGTEYVGDFVDGEFEGKGKLYYKNGDVYDGEFEDGLKEGKGTYTWKEGDKYTGEWMKDTMSGQGTYYFSKDNYLSGLFSDNRPSMDLQYVNKGKTINVEYFENGAYYEKK